jgi:hypothetical protein
MTDPQAPTTDGYRALHDLALRVVERLEQDFRVERSDITGTDSELEADGVALPTIRLQPAVDEAAPLVIAFTGRPGLHVRFGRHFTRTFPDSAGEEPLEHEAERFLWRVVQLVEGRFRESTRPGPNGCIVLEHEFWSPDGARAGGAWKVPTQGTAPGWLSASVDWKPWQRRAA